MKNNLTISPAGLRLIKNFEGLRLKAYQDVADVWTIGYGSTYYSNGKSIRPGDSLPDEAAASELLIYTLHTFTSAVNQLVKVTLTQNQFDALTSFAYNEGTGALAMSHLLIFLNEGKIREAADQFLLWDKATNQNTKQKEVVQDLLIRRRHERALFLTN